MPPSDDPIAELAAKLTSLWKNGMFPVLDLPATASTETVVAKAMGFDVTPYAIIEVRPVQIDHDPRSYFAALVDTNPGRKIVLARYEGNDGGWWSRVFAVPDSKPSPSRGAR